MPDDRHTTHQRGASSYASHRGRPKRVPFAQVIPSAVERTIEQSALSFDAANLLYRLTSLAGTGWEARARRRGYLENVTKTSLAERLGLNVGHGRRRFSALLDELRAADIIDFEFTQGGSGWLRVVLYEDLVNGGALPSKTAPEAAEDRAHTREPGPPPEPDRAKVRAKVRAPVRDRPGTSPPVDVLDSDRSTTTCASDTPEAVPDPGGGGPDPSRIEAVIDLRTDHEFVASNGPSKANPPGYRASIRRRVEREFRLDLEDAGSAHPEASAAELVTLVWPVAQPIDRSRPRRPPCSACDDHGVVESQPGSGAYVDCSCKSPAAMAVGL
ncbi:MAG: hypothetical protein ACYCTI_13135, partial [Acidimicrobiales bacterium]